MLDLLVVGNLVNCINLNIVLRIGIALDDIGYCFVGILNFFQELCKVYTWTLNNIHV